MQVMFVNCNNGDAPWDDLNTLTLSHMSQPMGLSLARHIFYSLLPSPPDLLQPRPARQIDCYLVRLIRRASFANPTTTSTSRRQLDGLSMQSSIIACEGFGRAKPGAFCCSPLYNSSSNSSSRVVDDIFIHCFITIYSFMRSDND